MSGILATTMPGNNKNHFLLLQPNSRYEYARDILPDIICPSRILHRTGDKPVNRKAGRDMASAIPNDRFVAPEGVDYWWLVGNSQTVPDVAQPYLQV